MRVSIISFATTVVLLFSACSNESATKPQPDPETPALEVTLSAQPASGTAPLTVQFNAEVSVAGEFTSTWDFGDGEVSEGGAQESHTYVVAGEFEASVAVAGPDGEASASVVVVVEESSSEPDNNVPTVTLTASESFGDAPLTVTFTADAQDPDGDELSYAWDFGDGVFVPGEPVETVTYEKPGSYSISVLVDDGRGGTAVDAISVIVDEQIDVPVGPRGEQILIGADASGVFTVYLGCLSCPSSHPESVHNPASLYGSAAGINSIFSQVGQYGSDFSDKSACNRFANNPPAIVDGTTYYGRLTMNRFHPEANQDGNLRNWLEMTVCN